MNYLKLKNNKLSIDLINNSENVKKNLTREEEYTIKFIKDWKNGKKYFEFETSGSTGKPKKIWLSREILTYSALHTLEFLRLSTPGKLLLCISPFFMGGSMVIVRSLVGKLDIEFISPTELLEVKETYDLVSLVPLQVRKILDTSPGIFNQFKNILIGGAPLHPSVEGKLLNDHGIDSAIYLTFGMTETASHFALRKIGEPAFRTIGDIRIGLDDRECLMVKGTVTKNQWLATNDRVEIVSDNSFIWLGRSDFTINSGGYKVQPEKVEKALSDEFPSENFLVIGIPDDALGEKVICLVEGVHQNINPRPDQLHPYEKPREYYFLSSFAYTQSGKVDRLATRKLFLNL